jgi:hypothetical protein
MYQLTKDGFMILRTTDGSYIPINPDNTDYIQFKKDLKDGVELQNADGEVMTKADMTEFMRGLP